jgi:signal transduction histidine kinase
MSSRRKIGAADRDSIAEIVLALAHDCSNLLAVAEFSAASAAREVDQESWASANLRIVRDALDRLSVMMQRIRAYSGRQEIVPEALSLNDLVKYVSSTLGPFLGEHVTLTQMLEPALPAIEADRLEMEQVLMNLLLNAREAIAPQGRIAVETRTIVLEEPRVNTSGHLGAGIYVLLAVADSGPGMSQATLARVFEPFFTTKGDGGGLGLAGSRRIVERYGGSIFIESSPGQGTRVEVFVPTRTPAAPAGPRRAPVARARQSSASPPLSRNSRT